MSRSTLSATTTYPYTYTTWSTSLSSTKFTQPTLIPSLFSFGPGSSCAHNSREFTAQPSQFPIGRPLGLQGACVISNARELNDHAFWDLYSCCKGGDMTAFGSPYICTAQCRAGNGQTFLELGECLSKKVDVVICKPPFEEIGKQKESSGAQSSRSVSSKGGASGGSATSAALSTGGAASNTVGVVQTGGAKIAGLILGVLALVSAAGMC